MSDEKITKGNDSQVSESATVTPAGKAPKVFISYSWTTPGHCDQIRKHAERLVSDGVEVILDQWDLSEGQDKNVFMEKMVTDQSVTHVLIFSDKEYAHKANCRKDGVGTESQIISKKVYESVDQKKFIPVVCERDEKGEPCLPVFLDSRIWVDFSSLEAVNENWESLLRALYGKPIHQKPALGKPPSYITEDTQAYSLPTIGKFASLKSAIENKKATVSACRNDFIDTAISYAETFRILKKPDDEPIDEKVLEDLHNLIPLRDQLIDWMLLETSTGKDTEITDALEPFLERLLTLKYRPQDLTSWNETWFDALRIFVYEIFLYLIAILIKNNRFSALHDLLTSNYLLPESEMREHYKFESFPVFWTNSKALEHRKQRLKLDRMSLIADIMKDRSTRQDITFVEIMQAELFAFLMTLIQDYQAWYPHTLVFSGRGGASFKLFLKAAQHRYFEKLKMATGVSSADELRRRFAKGYEDNRIKSWQEMIFWAQVMFDELLNLEALDTIK